METSKVEFVVLSIWFLICPKYFRKDRYNAFVYHLFGLFWRPTPWWNRTDSSVRVSAITSRGNWSIFDEGVEYLCAMQTEGHHTDHDKNVLDFWKFPKYSRFGILGSRSSFCIQLQFGDCFSVHSSQSSFLWPYHLNIAPFATHKPFCLAGN